MKTAIDEMLERISPYNLERIRVACETDGDRELAGIIAARLSVLEPQARSADARATRS